jgi:hypothetical protein
MSQNSFKPSDPVSGTLYVGGMATNRWVVYRSTDHGANWSPCDSFDYGGTPGGCLDLTVDSMGNVFATGIAHDVKGKSVWITRSLLAGADKWFTVDVPGSGNSSTSISGRGIAFSTNGGILAVGSLLSKNSQVWTVRRSTNSGTSWQTIYTGSTGSRANEVTVDSLGNIYVVGFDGSTALPVWTVRKSTNGGQTWQTIDSLSGSGAYGVTTAWEASALNVYVCGFGVGHWIVRKITPDGQVQTSDDYTGQPLAIASDSLGNVFATGFYRDTNNDGHWITRKLSAAH